MIASGDPVDLTSHQVLLCQASLLSSGPPTGTLLFMQSHIRDEPQWVFAAGPTGIAPMQKSEMENVIFPLLLAMARLESVMTSADVVEPNRGARGSARNVGGNDRHTHPTHC